MGEDDTLALRVSAISTPYMTTPIFILLAGLYYVHDPWDIIIYGAIVVGFTVVIPLSYAEHLRRRGKVESVHIYDQRARLGPLAITAACSMAALAALYAIDAPWGIIQLAVLLILLAGAVLAATYFFKVSGHVSSWTTGTTVLVLIYGPLAAVLYLVAVPIAWSRLRLERHTRAEVAVGFAYGIASAVVLSWAVGLWSL